MIKVQGLTKRYGDVVALDNVSFQVDRGEILGFLGPNGAGKTTTMRILTGFMPPSEGTAKLAGFDVLTDSLEVRRRVGYLPETVPLYREMTVHDYLDFVAAIRGVQKRERAIERVLDACDIGDVEEQIIGKLSKGYRQRVGLAQALIHDPDILVLDEPTIGLDPRQIRSVRELIKGLAGERTIILSTHILPEVSETCQRVLIINRGRIVAEDFPERLTANLQGGMRVRLELAKPEEDTVKALAAIPGITNVESLGSNTFEVTCDAARDARSEIASLVVTHGWGLLEMHTLSMSLEDIFLELTTEEATADDRMADQPKKSEAAS